MRLKLKEEPQALAELQRIRRRGSREARSKQARRVGLVEVERCAARRVQEKVPVGRDFARDREAAPGVRLQVDFAELQEPCRRL